MIPVEQAHLNIAAGTDPGIKGKNNEDQFAVIAHQLSTTNSTPSVFAMVADGIGGHRAGEVASEIAVEMISRAISESDASQPVTIMEAAILHTSQAIRAQAMRSEEQLGMGTTCVCAWVIGNHLYVTNVGNSRLYLLRGKRLYLLTTDHTWVQEAVDAGALTTEQARVHPHANIIRRYLGSEYPPEVDSRIRTDREGNYNDKRQGLVLHPGDRLLLCSDGLNDMIVDEVIEEQMNSRDLNAAVKGLILAANAKGGKDNITVVILEVPRKKGIAGLWEALRYVKPQLAVSYAGLIVMGLAIVAALVMVALELLE